MDKRQEECARRGWNGRIAKREEKEKQGVCIEDWGEAEEGRNGGGGEGSKEFLLH